MKCYCTKCQINWSHPLSCEAQIEVCPLCLNDMFLVDGKDEPVFYMCAVTAKVFELGTNKEMIFPYPVKEYYKSTDLPAMIETKTQHEAKEDKALESYFKSGNPEDYHKAFRN